MKNCVLPGKVRGHVRQHLLLNTSVNMRHIGFRKIVMAIVRRVLSPKRSQPDLAMRTPVVLEVQMELVMTRWMFVRCGGKRQLHRVKEIRFGPNTDDHDFQFKLKHARKFLQDGAKVKAYVFFRGRTIVFKERGEILLLKFAQELEDLGALEQMPKLEGKRMTVMFNPKKK